MADFIETPTVGAVLSLDAVKDESGAEFALLVLYLENGKTVRLPMPVDVAMRVWRLLDEARRDKGWPEPTTPVSSDPIQ